MSFAVTSTDYAYLHLEVLCSKTSTTSRFYGSNISNPQNTNIAYSQYNTSPENNIELDLICWKVILTKAMDQQLGISGQAIPTDIIHILNPDQSLQQQSNLDKRRIPHRRYLASSSSPSDQDQSSLSSSADSIVNDNENDSNGNFDSASIGGSYANQNSTCGGTPSLNPNNQKVQINPEAWIRVPESELTHIWAALSGYATTIDTGNHGTIRVGVRVIRASRYLPSVCGRRRNKW